jgi:hypothetical protein
MERYLIGAGDAPHNKESSPEAEHLGTVLAVSLDRQGSCWRIEQFLRKDITENKVLWPRLGPVSLSCANQYKRHCLTTPVTALGNVGAERRCYLQHATRQLLDVLRRVGEKREGRLAGPDRLDATGGLGACQNGLRRGRCVNDRLPIPDEYDAGRTVGHRIGLGTG